MAASRASACDQAAQAVANVLLEVNEGFKMVKGANQ